jgi:hypothetical protein
MGPPSIHLLRHVGPASSIHSPSPTCEERLHFLFTQPAAPAPPPQPPPKLLPSGAAISTTDSPVAHLLYDTHETGHPTNYVGSFLPCHPRPGGTLPGLRLIVTKLLTSSTTTSCSTLSSHSNYKPCTSWSSLATRRSFTTIPFTSQEMRGRTQPSVCTTFRFVATYGRREHLQHRLSHLDD